LKLSVELGLTEDTRIKELQDKLNELDTKLNEANLRAGESRPQEVASDVAIEVLTGGEILGNAVQRRQRLAREEQEQIESERARIASEIAQRQERARSVSAGLSTSFGGADTSAALALFEESKKQTDALFKLFNAMNGNTDLMRQLIQKVDEANQARKR